MRKLLVVIAVVAVVAAASADRMAPAASSAALRAPHEMFTRALPYATGFDSTEGYVPGPIGGQQGWTMFVASTAEGHVDTVNPLGGDQHLRISYDPAVSMGTTTGAFSPNQGALGAGFYSAEVAFNIGATGGADYDVITQAPSQGLLSARVKFYWDDWDGDSFAGDMVVLDDVGSGLQYVDTGYDYVPGEYHTLRIDVDSIGNSLTYYIDNTLVYTGFAGVFAGTSIEQMVLISDNYQYGESGDFDNVLISPEPASLALLALAMFFRRR